MCYILCVGGVISGVLCVDQKSLCVLSESGAQLGISEEVSVQSQGLGESDCEGAYERPHGSVRGSLWKTVRRSVEERALCVGVPKYPCVSV